MSTASTTQLQSERVIVQAPLSFAGSTKRILRLTEPRRAMAIKPVVGPWWKGTLLVLLDGLVILSIAVFMLLAWVFILCWYLVWGIFLVPYRLIRRSDRNRKREELQHREMLDAAIAAQAQTSQQLAALANQQVAPPAAASEGMQAVPASEEIKGLSPSSEDAREIPASEEIKELSAPQDDRKHEPRHAA